MQLQKAPVGFLGWFALKVGGANPPLMSDAVVPTVDVGDSYLASGELGIDTITQASGLASFITMDFTVPSGKVWRVHGAGGDIGVNAADVAIVSQGAIQVLAPDAGVIGCNLLPTQAGQSGAGVTREIGTYFPRPIFLTPGWRIRVAFLFTAALTVSVNGHAALFRNQIDL